MNFVAELGVSWHGFHVEFSQLYVAPRLHSQLLWLFQIPIVVNNPAEGEVLLNAGHGVQAFFEVVPACCRHESEVAA